MQKYLPLVALLLFGACQPNSSNHTAEGLVSQEIFTTSLGDVQVYGIAIKTTATPNSQRGFAISFSVNDKTWLDTLRPDLNTGDTLVSEVIFSEAKVGDGQKTALNIESFNLD